MRSEAWPRAVEARLAECRTEWDALRRSCEPADRSEAEAGIRSAYRSAGLAQPEAIVWCNGPGELADALERKGLVAGENVKDIIATRPMANIERSVRSQLPIHAARSLLGHRDLHARDRSSRNASLAFETHLSEQIPPRGLIARLRDKIVGGGRPLWMERKLTDMAIGQHDAFPFHIYDFVRSAEDAPSEWHALDGLLKALRHVGWIVPQSNLCFAVERHSVLKVDDTGDLHARDGPALVYPDGWRLYAWKGVQVPDWAIENSDSIQIYHMEREPNAIVRHCLADIVSAQRFIKSGWARRVGEDFTGVLWQRQWRLGGTWAVVEVVNGTPEEDGTRQHFFLNVPGNLITPCQAVAWTYGLQASEYVRLRFRT